MEGVGVTAGAPASQVSSPTGASTPPASALPWVEGGAESRVSDAQSHACQTRRVTRVGRAESRMLYVWSHACRMCVLAGQCRCEVARQNHPRGREA